MRVVSSQRNELEKDIIEEMQNTYRTENKSGRRRIMVKMIIRKSFQSIKISPIAFPTYHDQSLYPEKRGIIQ